MVAPTMDPDGAMTQYPKGKIRPGLLLFGAAALVFGSAVGVSLARRNADEAPAAPTNGEAAANSRSAAQARFDQGDYAGAARAYRQAAEAEPDRAVLWSALGEAQVMASRDDPLPAEALAHFRRALALDPKDPRARYFLAVKRDLDGDHMGAIDAWLALLADTPAGAPWEADLKRTIEQVGKINAIPVASRIAAVKQPGISADGPGLAAAAIPGPSSEDLRAAAAIPPSEQRAMAEGMVARLDAKLRANPRNVAGWVMLMRSRMTLGQADAAAAALRDAVAANPGEAGRLRQEARSLGVGGA